MKIEQQILFRLLGDYYLHAATPSAQEIAVANEVGSMLHRRAQAVASNLKARWLSYGNKYQMHLGYVSIENGAPALFDIKGNRISSDTIVSPYDGKLSDIDEIAKQMQEHRHSKRLVYYTVDDERHIGLLAGSILDDFEGRNADIARTIIMLRPHNRRMVEDIASALLGAPLALDNETIIKKTQDYIITTKNIYRIEHAARFEKPIGHKLTMFEPVYGLVKIDISDTKHAAKIVSLIERASWSNASYAKKILRTLLHNYFVVQLPIEVVSGNDEAIRIVSAIFRHTSIMDGGAMTFLESDESVYAVGGEANMIASHATADTIETYALQPKYFDHDDSIDAVESAQTGTSERGSFVTSERYTAGASQRVEERSVVGESWEFGKSNEEALSATESDDKSGQQERAVLVNTGEQIEQAVPNADEFYLFSDDIEARHIARDVIETLEADLMETKIASDDILLASDTIEIDRFVDAAAALIEKSEPRTKVSHEDHAGSISTDDTTFAAASDSAQMSDFADIYTQHEDNAAPEEGGMPETVSVLHEEIDVAESETIASIASDVLIVRDEMEVDTDTTIDEF